MGRSCLTLPFNSFGPGQGAVTGGLPLPRRLTGEVDSSASICIAYTEPEMKPMEHSGADIWRERIIIT
ncbi:unnamed protein product [Caretta caretta]